METERLCGSIEEHEARIHRAFGKMAEVAEEARAAKEAAAGEAPGCEACGEGYSCGDCSSCSGCADGERLAGPSAPLPAEPAFYGAQKGEEGGEAADDE